MSSPYKLSLTLTGHTGDVRALCASPAQGEAQQLLLSSSRDASSLLWRLPSSSSSSQAQAELTQPERLASHEGYVNANAWLPTSAGLVALTAGQDGLINGHLLDHAGIPSSSADYTLVGHSSNVCALDVFAPAGSGSSESEESYVVSGSWDQTARVWRNFKPAYILTGATQAVWAVLALDATHVLTASADKLVRLYALPSPAAATAPAGAGAGKEEELSPLAVFPGHQDAVRALLDLGDGRFASAGNDSNINIYALPSPLPSADTQLGASGPARIFPTQTLSAHTSFVYSLSRTTSGEVMSAGEDRSVRIWRGDEVQQTITIPAVSVWAVAGLANGDLACAASDGVVRVFSRAKERWADRETLAAYDAAVASQALNKTQVGDVSASDLPDLSALSQPGKKEGQVLMVRNAVGGVEAHQWSVADSRWVKIGDVVGGVGSGSKKLYEGKEWDYVFDVDIADGVPPLKLPYNLAENPYVAAMRFINRNELPQSYLDQVVRFIETNTEGKSLGANEEYVDPYTGASRYTAQPAASSSSSAAPAPRPAAYTQGSNPDPYTASAAPAAASKASKAPGKMLPQTDFLSFAALNAVAVQSKIEAFSSELGASNLALPDASLYALSQLLTLGSSNLSPLVSALQTWPLSHRFPLLDVLRFAALRRCSLSATEVVELALGAAEWSEEWPAAGEKEGKSRDTCAMLALRACANTWSSGDTGLVESAEETIMILQSTEHVARLSKNARVAYVTVLLNYAIHLVRVSSPLEYGNVLLGALNDVLERELALPAPDGEVTFRALIAVGDVLLSPSHPTLEPSLRAQALTLAQRAASVEERCGKVVAEIGAL